MFLFALIVYRYLYRHPMIRTSHLVSYPYTCTRTYCNEEQTSERSDGVSSLSNGRLCAGAREKIPERLPTAWAYLLKLLFLPLCVGVLVCWCVHRRSSFERHRKSIDIDPL